MDAFSSQRPPVSGRTKLIGAIVTLAIIVALGLLAWKLTHRAPAGAMPGMGAGGMRGGGPGGPGGAFNMATTVGTAKVERASIPVTLEALGTVTPAATVTVRPQVSGVISEIRFREGQLVKKGEILAVLDPRPFQMSLAQSEGTLQRDEAQLENAKLTLERYRTLIGQDSISQQEVDTQAATVKQLEGTVATDRAAVGTARLNLEFSRVQAPLSGRVGLRVVDAGNYIAAGDASGIAVITQMTPIDVEFTLPQDRITDLLARVAEGATLPATALDRTRALALAEGQFLTLDNQVNTETGTVRAKARFANTDTKLFPSQFVNLRLILRTVDDALVLPVSAVRNGAQGDYVYVVKDDRTVTMQSVQRGLMASDKVQVTGLAAGTLVVTEGGDRLKEGAQVMLPGEAPKMGAGFGGKPGADGKPGAKPGERKRPEGAPTPQSGKPANAPGNNS